MATWTNVPNSSIETDKPVRAVDIRALRDNPIAIAGGASGAPRVVNGALDSYPWGTADIEDGAVTLPKLERLAPGGAIRSRIDAETPLLTEETQFETRHSFIFMQVGTVRCTIQHRSDSISTPGTTEVRVLRIRNDASTVLQTFSTSNTSFQTATLDAAVQMGDRLLLQYRQASFNGRTTFRRFRFQTNGENLFTATQQLVEGNAT